MAKSFVRALSFSVLLSIHLRFRIPRRYYRTNLDFLAIPAILAIFIALLSRDTAPKPYLSFPVSGFHENRNSLVPLGPNCSRQYTPLLPKKKCRQTWFACYQCQAFVCNAPEFPRRRAAYN